MFQQLAKRNGLIGIDIGASCVKVVQLARPSGRMVVQRAMLLQRSLPNAKGAAERPLFSAGGLGDLLQACHDFSGRDSSAVLSMSACEVKSERCDAGMSPAGMKDMAARLADRDSCLPQPLGHDCWQSQTDENSHLIHVLATPQKLTQQVVQQQRRVGWDCGVLDGIPTALARAVAMSGASEDSPIAAIDWGWSQVTLCIVRNGQAMFVRSFPRGSLATIIEALCSKLHLTRREAWQLVSQVGISGVSSNSAKRTAATVARCVSACVQQFEQEVKRTLDYIAGRHRAMTPEQIVLLGGGATIAQIDDHVSRKCDLPASVWSFPHIGEKSDPATAALIPLLGPAIALSALAWESSR